MKKMLKKMLLFRCAGLVLAGWAVSGCIVQVPEPTVAPGGPVATTTLTTAPVATTVPTTAPTNTTTVRTATAPVPTATTIPSVTKTTLAGSDTPVPVPTTGRGSPTSTAPAPIPTTGGQGATPVLHRITFPAGETSASVQGTVPAFGLDRWVVNAQAGQTMTAQLTPSDGQVFLVIFGVDGNVLISDHAGAAQWSGQIPSTQDYYIDVRGNPSTATNYTLTVTIPPVVPPTPTARRITFAPGATTASVQGTVPAFGLDRWVVNAQAGQTMTAQLTPSDGQVILVIFGADGNVMISDHAAATQWSGQLPSTQDYYIDVRGNPNTATAYTLQVTLPPLK